MSPEQRDRLARAIDPAIYPHVNPLLRTWQTVGAVTAALAPFVDELLAEAWERGRLSGLANGFPFDNPYRERRE